MLHFVSKNSATLDIQPLTKYRRTFKQAEAKAKKTGRNHTLEFDFETAMVLIFRQGSFTISSIINGLGMPITFGYAKRNIAFDAENSAKSENIAVHRAISNCFVEQVIDMERQPDSLVLIPEQWDVDELRAAMNKPGTIFEVNRIKPLMQKAWEKKSAEMPAKMQAAAEMFAGLKGEYTQEEPAKLPDSIRVE